MFVAFLFCFSLYNPVYCVYCKGSVPVKMEEQIQQAKARAESFSKSLEESRNQEAAVMRLLEDERLKWTEALEEKGVLIEQLERELEATVDEIHRQRKASLYSPEHHSTNLHSELDLVTKAKDMSKRILSSYRDTLGTKSSPTKASISQSHQQPPSPLPHTAISDHADVRPELAISEDELASLKARLHVTQVERDYLLKELQAISLTANQQMEPIQNIVNEPPMEDDFLRQPPYANYEDEYNAQDQHYDYDFDPLAGNHQPLQAYSNSFMPKFRQEYGLEGGYEYNRAGYQVDANASSSFSSVPPVSASFAASRNSHHSDTYSGSSLQEKTLRKIHDGLRLVSNYRKSQQLGQINYSNDYHATAPQTMKAMQDDLYDDHNLGGKYTSSYRSDEFNEFARTEADAEPPSPTPSKKSTIIVRRKKKKKDKAPSGPAAVYVLNSEQYAALTGGSTATHSTATSRLASRPKKSTVKPTRHHASAPRSTTPRFTMRDRSQEEDLLVRLYSSLTPRSLLSRSESPRYSTRRSSSAMHSLLQPTESSARRQSPAPTSRRARSSSADTGARVKQPWIPPPVSSSRSGPAGVRSNNSRSISNSRGQVRKSDRNRSVEPSRRSSERSPRFTIIEERKKSDAPSNPPTEPPKLITVLDPEFSTEPLLYELSEGNKSVTIIGDNHRAPRVSFSSPPREVSRSRDSQLELPKMSMSMPTIAPSVMSRATNRTRQSFSSLNSCGSNLHDHLHLLQTEASAQKLVYPPLRQSYPFTPAIDRESSVRAKTPPSARSAARQHWNREVTGKKK